MGLKFSLPCEDLMVVAEPYIKELADYLITEELLVHGAITYLRKDSSQAALQSNNELYVYLYEMFSHKNGNYIEYLDGEFSDHVYDQFNRLTDTLTEAIIEVAEFLLPMYNEIAHKYGKDGDWVVVRLSEYQIFIGVDLDESEIPKSAVRYKLGDRRDTSIDKHWII